MLQNGIAKKVTVYVNEDAKYHHTPLYEAILNYLRHKGVAGATATRAMAGFGVHRVVHSAKVEALAEHLPVRIEFIDSAAVIDCLLPGLNEMVNDGLIEVQDTQVVKLASSDNPEAQAPREECRGKAKLMRIYLGESDRWEGQPLYEAIVQQLRVSGIAGATVYRGILGYGVKKHTHKEGRLPFSRDLPIMIAVIEAPEKLDAVMERIESMLQDGIIVYSDVDVVRLVRSAPGTEPSDASV